MGWDVGLASMFKERNNKSLIGPCVGKVVSVDPLKVSILNGDVVLEGDQLYMPSGLLEKEFKCDIKASGDIGEITGVAGNLKSLDITKDTGLIKLHFELKEGNDLLLIPTENEQTFFIIDIVKKVGG